MASTDLKRHSVTHFNSVFDGPVAIIKLSGPNLSNKFYTRDVEHIRQIVKDLERVAQYLEGKV